MGRELERHLRELPPLCSLLSIWDFEDAENISVCVVVMSLRVLASYLYLTVLRCEGLTPSYINRISRCPHCT